MELVVFPLAISIRQSNKVTIGLLLLLLLVSATRRYRSEERLNLAPLGLLLACVAVVLWQGPYSIACLYALAAVLLVNTATTVTRESAYASMLAGLSLYLGGNLAGWLVGVKSASESVRIGGYESAGGIFSSRVFFPFAFGINEPAWIAAALIAAVAAMISMRRRPLWYHWAGVVAGAFVILAANSRTPILFAVPFMLFLLIAPRLSRFCAPCAAGILLLLPFFMTPIQPILNWIAAFVSTNAYLARGQNVEDIVGLSSREGIWAHSIEYWADHVTQSAHQFFGYGFLGHVRSGAAATYNSGVGDQFSDRSALTMHNSVLQTLFDAGLIGALLLFVVTVFMIYRYSRISELLPMFSVAVIITLSASVEITLAPGLAQTPIFFILYLLVFVPNKQE